MADRKTNTKSSKTSLKTTITKPVRSSRAVSSTRTSKKNITPILTKTKDTIITPTSSLKVRRSYIIAVLAILIIVVLAYLGRNLVIAAVVNGQPISRLSVIKDLEKQGGKQTLDTIITKTLISQEANKKGITVTQKEIDDDLKKIETNLEKQGQKLDQVLALQGMTKDQLVEQIRLQKIIEKLVGKIAVSEKEIDDYITANKDSLPTDQDEKTKRSSVKQTLEQQKLNQKAQVYLENLRKTAKIDYFVQY